MYPTHIQLVRDHGPLPAAAFLAIQHLGSGCNFTEVAVTLKIGIGDAERACAVLHRAGVLEGYRYNPNVLVLVGEPAPAPAVEPAPALEPTPALEPALEPTPKPKKAKKPEPKASEPTVTVGTFDEGDFGGGDL